MRSLTVAGVRACVPGSCTTYNVAASGMTSDGTVIATVPVGSNSPSTAGAQDAAGNGNTASSSTDNTVTYDTHTPTASTNSPQYPTAHAFSASINANDASPSSGLDSVDLYVKTPNASSYALAHHFGSALASDSFSYTASDGDGNYLFYSVATDKAGNAEAAPSSPDTTTLVDTQQPNSSASSPAYSTSPSFSVSYSATDPVKSGSLGPASGLDSFDLYVNTPNPSSYALSNHFGS